MGFPPHRTTPYRALLFLVDDAAKAPPPLPELTAPQAEEVRKTAGQREINLLWENTQMKVALSVIWASLLVALVLAVFGKWIGSADLQLAAVVFLFGVANLVTGFYFGRTNHTRTGGVGVNKDEAR